MVAFVTASIVYLLQFGKMCHVRASSFGRECGYFSWNLILAALTVTLGFSIVILYLYLHVATRSASEYQRSDILPHSIYCTLCDSMGDQKKVSLVNRESLKSSQASENRREISAGSRLRARHTSGRSRVNLK